jgi:ribosomal protein S8
MHFLSNLLSSLRNAKASRLSHIVFIQPQNAIPKAIFDILTLLRKNGMIRGFSCIEISISGKVKFMIYLKYDESGKSVIDSLFLVSKPSRRIYMSSSAI